MVKKLPGVEKKVEKIFQKKKFNIGRKKEQENGW